MNATINIKKTTILTFIMITFLSGNAQDTITIAETTFKMKGNSEESFFFGFAEGDIMLIQMEETQKKPIKEFEIIEGSSSSKYRDINTSSINKEIRIPRTSVYEFRLKTAFLAPRTCRLVVSRIPKDSTTTHFNTAWEWKTVYDTAYIPYTIDSIVGYDTIYYKETVSELVSSEKTEESVLDETVTVGAQMSLNGNGQHYYKRFSLPNAVSTKDNRREVVSWAYWIGVGDEASRAWQRGVNSMKGLAEAVAATCISPLGATALGVAIDWTMPTSGENVQYNIDDSYGNTISRGDCISTAKTVSDPYKNKGDYIIHLYNDNIVQKINVKLRVIAIVENKTYHDVTYDRIRIDTRTVTLNKTRMEVTPRQIRVNAK